MHKPTFIAIGGMSASGKTTLAQLISKKMGKTQVISLDWFYKDITDKSLGPTYNWDTPDAFDWDLLEKVLAGLENGVSQWVPQYDFARYSRADYQIAIVPARIIILEGLFAFANEKINKFLSYKLYIYCDPDIAVCRRILRDTRERGYDIELIVNRYLRFVRPAHKRYAAMLKQAADLIIYNSDDKDTLLNTIDTISLTIDKIADQNTCPAAAILPIPT